MPAGDLVAELVDVVAGLGEGGHSVCDLPRLDGVIGVVEESVLRLEAVLRRWPGVYEDAPGDAQRRRHDEDAPERLLARPPAIEHDLQAQRAGQGGRGQ